MIKRIVGLLLITFIMACSKQEQGPSPGTFTLTNPLKDQVCTSGKVISATQSKVSFVWNKAANANSYDLTITNLLTQTAATQTVTSTSDTVTLLQNTPYSWYVTAKAPKTTAVTKSDVWKFYSAGSGIVTYAPFPAAITAPTLGQIVTSSGGNINLTWTGSSVSNNIVGYYVYFGPTNNPGLFKSNVTDSFVNNVSVSANTTYYWHIITVDANGNISDSGISNFFVTK